MEIKESSLPTTRARARWRNVVDGRRKREGWEENGKGSSRGYEERTRERDIERDTRV